MTTKEAIKQFRDTYRLVNAADLFKSVTAGTHTP